MNESFMGVFSYEEVLLKTDYTGITEKAASLSKD